MDFLPSHLPSPVFIALVFLCQCAFSLFVLLFLSFSIDFAALLSKNTDRSPTTSDLRFQASHSSPLVWFALLPDLESKVWSFISKSVVLCLASLHMRHAIVSVGLSALQRLPPPLRVSLMRRHVRHVVITCPTPHASPLRRSSQPMPSFFGILS
jgi:hypothetical protein